MVDLHITADVIASQPMAANHPNVAGKQPLLVFWENRIMRKKSNQYSVIGTQPALFARALLIVALLAGASMALAPFVEAQKAQQPTTSNTSVRDVMQKGLDGTPELLIDPNKLSSDGTSQLGAFSLSKDGKYLGYGVSQGSDWHEIHVMEVAQ
jgi:hypothetical protein